MCVCMCVRYTEVIHDRVTYDSDRLETPVICIDNW